MKIVALHKLAKKIAVGVDPGDRLREARERLGLKRTEVAGLSNLPLASLIAMETGRYGVKPELAARLAPVLAVTVDWILRGPAASI